METGVHGPLRSTIPPWTFPAWTSFMTGKNPGKHGIFDFFRTRPGTYNLEFVNGGHRRGMTFWKILSDAGRSVVSISLPCTFPPEPVNGEMISGFDFPGEGPGSYVDARGMHPQGLYEELSRNVGRHPIDAPIIKEINRGRFDLVLERVLQTIRQKAATAKYLLSHRSWDCFMILLGNRMGPAINSGNTATRALLSSSIIPRGCETASYASIRGSTGRLRSCWRSRRPIRSPS